jgi:uncharacterized protein YegP (UPF0339 family)
MQVAKIEVLGNWTTGYYWHIVANNGRKLAWSAEKYRNKTDCLNGLNWVRQYIGTIPIVDMAT